MPQFDLGKVVGSRTYNVIAAPEAALGLENDWALDTTTGDAYEKTDTGWVKRGNLKGATGADGKTPTFEINADGHLIATFE